MLTIYGPRATKSRFCDGQSRRDFLKIGGMVMGGLALNLLWPKWRLWRSGRALAA